MCANNIAHLLIYRFLIGGFFAKNTLWGYAQKKTEGSPLLIARKSIKIKRYFSLCDGIPSLLSSCNLSEIKSKVE